MNLSDYTEKKVIASNESDLRIQLCCYIKGNKISKERHKAFKAKIQAIKCFSLDKIF